MSPIPQRVSCSDKKQVTWSDAQKKIVGDLMNEANQLLEMFDQVAMLLGPDIKLHNVSGNKNFLIYFYLINKLIIDVENFEMEPNPYNEEMLKSCETLEASLSKLKSFNSDKV